MRCVAVILLFVMSGFAAVASAADWLMSGVHEVATTRTGITCTVVVPPAVTDGKPMPVLFVLAPDGQPNAKRWQEWGDHRGCVVVGINGFRWTSPISKNDLWQDCVNNAAEIYAAAMVAVKSSVPVHSFLRFVTGAKASMAMAVALTKQEQEDFGGLLMVSPWIDSTAVGELRAEVPVVLVIGANNQGMLSTAGKVAERLLSDGGTIKTATVDDLGDEEPSFDVHTRAMDWLMNISRATHKRFTARERKANLEEIATQAQELPGLVSPTARRECAGFLMAVPGMDKLKREYERLADVWLESSIEIAKARAEKDAVDAHEFLSVVVKNQRFQEAGGKQRKAAQTELTRMRKDPVVRKEVAAYDLVADACAMLDHDESLAKQRIALKDLQAVIDQYPMTHAAKTAAKLVTKIQQNLR